jgi:hypothetical protein
MKLDSPLECGYYRPFSRQFKHRFTVDKEGINIHGKKNYLWSDIESVCSYGWFYWSFVHTEVCFNDGYLLRIWRGVHFKSDPRKYVYRRTPAYVALHEIIFSLAKNKSAPVEERLVRAAIPVMLIMLIIVPIIMLVDLRINHRPMIISLELLFVFLAVALGALFLVRFRRGKS